MSPRILPAEIERYLASLVPAPEQVLVEMEREGAQRGFPIVGRTVGRLLELLARSVQARRVLELGSGFGYSAYWFARAVGQGGEVILTDLSADNLAQACDFLGRAGLGERVRTVQGDALALVDMISGPFDVVFCDIDKHDYPRVPAIAAGLLRAGGLLLVDNALWRGQVAEDPPPDDTTAAVVEMNRILATGAEWLTSLIPLRDGVSVSFKR